MNVNATNISWPDLERAENIFSIIVPIFFGLIAITGFFDNLLVIFVVLSNRQMHSTTNLLIVNLACADLLFVIFCIPFTASDYVFREWPYSLAWCKIVQYLIVVTVCASIYTLVLMSLDRFLAVVHPITSRTIRTERITKLSILLLWIIIVILAIPVLFLHGLEESYINEHKHISCIFSTSDIMNKTYQTIFLLATYLLPLTLISCMYICIVIRLKTSHVGDARMSIGAKKGRKRVTKLVVVVVTSFALLWLPIQVILILKSYEFYDISLFKLIMQIVAQTVAYTSACINPLLYAFFSENFRKAFQKAMNCSYRYIPYSATPSNNSNINNNHNNHNNNNNCTNGLLRNNVDRATPPTGATAVLDY